ncbi:MAG TPA: hypothetical protein VFA23_07840 [Dongiaceae bacterium]|nr:hypothetical protein [Dongiaceae bacterium]
MGKDRNSPEARWMLIGVVVLSAVAGAIVLTAFFFAGGLAPN